MEQENWRIRENGDKETDTSKERISEDDRKEKFNQK
jgi:hypothetical protein